MKQMIPHIGFIFKRNIRDRKNIYYIIMMGLCSLILLCCLHFMNMRNYGIRWMNEHEISSRQLVIKQSYDEILKYLNDKNYDFNIGQLKQIEHVVDVHSFNGDYIVLNNTKIGDFEGNYLGLYYGDNNIIPKVIKGKNINADEKNVIVCPAKFYPNTYSDNLKSSDLLDGKDILGKTISGSYSIRKLDEKTGKIVDDETITLEFKVVGLYEYDSDSNSPSECYAPGKQVENIYKDMQKNNDSIDTSLLLTVDKFENKDLVKKELSKLGIMYSDKSYREENTEAIINSICETIILVSVSVILLVGLAYIKKKILNNMSEIGITKSLGYNKNQIRSMYILDNFSIVLLSYFLVNILLFPIVIIIRKFFYPSVKLLGVRWHIALWPFIATLFLMILCSSIINYFYISKRLKRNPTQMLNGETTWL